MSNVMYIGIDLQDGFLTDDITRTGYTKRVEEFLAAQDTSAVILTRFVNQPDSNFEKLLDWPQMQKDDPTIKLFGELEQQGYDIVEKDSYTAWLPYVQEKAKKLGCTKFVLFGLDSDACVFKTALDIFEAGYEPIILRDLCQSSGGEERHQAGLELMKLLIGVRQIITSDKLRVD